MVPVNEKVDLMGTVGERLRQERSLLGMSQSEFAAIAGQSKKSQMRYESDERSPDAEYLSALAQHDIDVLYILTGERRSGLPSPSAAILPTRLRERLRDAIEAIEEGLAATGRTAAPAVKAEMVMAAYDILGTEGEGASAEIIRLVRTA